MILQKTLKKPVQISGIGLHSGRTVTMDLYPAKTHSGIVFVRNDLNPPQRFKSAAKRVSDTVLCTVLAKDDTPDSAEVATVEHIMSALSGLGVDNVEIHLDAGEVPIVDGSAAPFVYLIQNAGLVSQDAAKQFIVVKSPVEVRDGDKWAKLTPHPNQFKLDFTIDFNHPAIRKSNNHFSHTVNTQAYVQDISRARTFGFLRDIEYLRQNNLALGGSLDNAVVVDEYRVLNDSGLRYQDEFVRHKLLDAIGDLYLEGLSIVGHYMGYKSGHALNNQLFRALLDDERAYEITTLSGDDIAQNDAPVAPLEKGYLF